MIVIMLRIFIWLTIIVDASVLFISDIRLHN